MERDHRGESTRSSLKEQLHQMGIRPGDRLAVHSSYRALGPVRGGPAEAIRALMDAVTPAGTLVMPTFQGLPLKLFRVHETRTDCGVITEMFWRMPGVRRSLHPTHSAAAWADRAEWIIAAHEEGRTALGVDSPFDRLAQLGGKVLLLGVGQNRNSMVHVGEAHVRPVYLPIPYSPEFARPMLVEDRAGRVYETVIAECPGCSENFDVVGTRMARHGMLREGPVGNAKATVMAARDVIAVVRELLMENPMALLCDQPGCSFCPSARAAVLQKSTAEHA